MALGNDQYNIAIQVSAETRQAQASLDQLAATTSGLDKSALPATESLGDLADSVGDVGDAADVAGGAAGGLGRSLELMAGFVSLAAIAIGILAKKLYDVYQEHVRVKSVSERLDLPVQTVSNYSDAWEGVAIQLNDAARGFDDLAAAQKRAFTALSVDPASTGAADRIKARIAAAEGSRAEKIDALRIVTGLSYEEASKELDSELKRLNEFVVNNRRGGGVRRGEREGAGGENLSTLFATGAIVPPEFLKQQEALGKAVAKLQEDFDKSYKQALKDEDEAFLDSLEIRVTAQRVYHDKQAEIDQAYYDGLDALTKTSTERQIEKLDQIEFALNQLYETGRIGAEQQQQRMQEAVDAVLTEVQVTAKRVGDGTDPALKQLSENIKTYFTDPMKEALDNFVVQGEFSVKRLVANIIASLLKRELYDAIDALGKAIEDALNPSVGGGGLFGRAARFVSGLFGFAGGGVTDQPTLVGESGPELVLPGRDGATVLNMRQLAFAGGGGQQSGNNITYAPAYTISGVDTQQVIAYVETTRERDQRDFAQRMKDNGFGRLR